MNNRLGRHLLAMRRPVPVGRLLVIVPIVVVRHTPAPASPWRTIPAVASTVPLLECLNSPAWYFGGVVSPPPLCNLSIQPPLQHDNRQNRVYPKLKPIHW